MTLSKDLFLSILAMDSYNRGYDKGLRGLGGLGSFVGSAKIALQSDIAERTDGVAADFYALSYEIGSDGPEGLAAKTVISYRGTNSAIDHSTGWSVGAGNIDDWTQAPLTLEFYDGVAD